MAVSLRALRSLFYLERPGETSFSTVEEVPDYFDQAIPCLVFLVLLESLVRWLQGKTLLRINDTMSSATAGLMELLLTVVTGAVELTSYVWVYDRFNLVALPWNSAITWWLTFVSVDFCYYWFHRKAHEVNLFWASHQVHHSSEEFNISTASRQSIVQHFTSWFFYLPMALAIPPSVYLVHKQFNLLYQFWIHTEVISSLGPLEWILNTPSHHRVHHGRNHYCIDKNYGGVLIIWDRLFGTFEPEQEDEQILYGLVFAPGCWNPLWTQLYYFYQVAMTLVYMEGGVWGRMGFLYHGPSWLPGLQQKLHLNFNAHINEERPYNPAVPRWLSVYCLSHFLLVLHCSRLLVSHRTELPLLLAVMLMLYLMWSLTNFGLMFDRHWLSPVLEVGRLVLLLLADTALCESIGLDPTGWEAMTVRLVAVLSLSMWLLLAMKQLCSKRSVK